MSSYVLHHGDCLDVLPTLETQSVDAVIADIPSGRTTLHWDSPLSLDSMWACLNRLRKPATPIVLLGLTQPATSFVIQSNLPLFKYEWVWEKSIPGGFANAHRQPLRNHESILVFYEQQCSFQPIKQQSISDQAIKAAKLGKVVQRANGNSQNNHGFGTKKLNSPFQEYVFPTSVQFFPSVPRQHLSHETEKPLDLMEYLVKTYTHAGDTVLDFTMGSGTTGAACGNLGRNFIGIEKDAHYFAVARDRIARAYDPLAEMVA